MKGILFYHTITGNTLLAGRYLVSRLSTLEWTYQDITQPLPNNLESFDLIGLAFPTFHLGIEPIVRTFLERLPQQEAKAAFLLNTYGIMPGKALKIAEEMLYAKGYVVMAYHSLMMPENYPVFIQKGYGSTEHPDLKQMAAFNEFIAQLNQEMMRMDSASFKPTARPVKLDMFSRLLGVKSKKAVMKAIEGLSINESKCIRCGHCMASCPYGAIIMDGRPKFYKDRCEGCWSCYHHCPQKAFTSRKVHENFQYDGPSPQLAERLR